ncbi:MAG TPA: potassium transporter TrkG [Bacteroidales bacterium]|nr:potassium transporter TrkG [Bacteroidales bacterium]
MGLRKLRHRSRIIKGGFARHIPLLLITISVLILLFDVGFDQNPQISEYIDKVYLVSLIIGVVSTILRYFFRNLRPRLKAIPFDIIYVVFLTFLFLIRADILQDNFFPANYFAMQIWIYFAIILVFIREFSELEISFKSTKISPAIIFVFSFFFIIITGALLLMLPNAANGTIRFIDALFTSTSAVCVTGLAVVDTGTFYTVFGQLLIVFLIQVGGLGIMTFASYFSYFFKGGSTFRSQVALQDMTSADKIGEVFVILKRILFLTFLIELIGAVLIFFSINETVIPLLTDRIFFSVFHAVSGFCNAGFSTMSNGLYEPILRFNYPLHLIIAFLIIFGGLGFPIIFNLYKYFINIIGNFFKRVFLKKQPKVLPWIINVNTRIVLITTVILLVLGTVSFFGFEYNNTLAEHGLVGKVVTSFFSSVTTRTAGFNSVDFSQVGIPATLILIFLMWVGASPASTGGGIKTSTLAVAVLNIFSLAKNKTDIEVFRRRISESSVDRAFAIIILSIFVISIATFLLLLTDANFGLLNIVFEVVSAYATVGLSRGITPQLSDAGKTILILTMFIGRVNMLTILIALFNKFSHQKYKYPTDTILIN